MDQAEVQAEMPEVLALAGAGQGFETFAAAVGARQQIEVAIRKVMAHRSSGLAHWGVAASFRSPELGAERGRQAIELARRHGWSGEPVVARYPLFVPPGACPDGRSVQRTH